MTSAASFPNDSPRRSAVSTTVGSVTLGGDAPVRVQSMTNTDTADVAATVAQIVELVEAGSELVRFSVGNAAAAEAVPHIRDRLLAREIDVPLIGDFHFNGHQLLAAHPACAEALDKYRINPGNVGRGKRRDVQFAEMIEIACRYNKVVRIGVNWGSLDSDLLSAAVDANNRSANPLPADALVRDVVVRSALESARLAESIGLPHHGIVLSAKHSRVPAVIDIYRRLASACDYPLHVGLTEAGMGMRGVIASTAALSTLLLEGVGDTIRVSLTPDPDGARAREVRVAMDLLQSIGRRAFRPTVVSCPGCGRTRGDYFQRLSADVEAHIETRFPEWRKRCPGVESLTVAVMGCVVNGPGESRHADIGVSLPGANECLAAPVYIDGQRVATLKGDALADDFKTLLDDYVVRRFGND